MDGGFSAPHQGPGSMSLIQPAKQYKLQGEIALSLSLCEADFQGARALLDLILLLEPLNNTDLVLSVAGGPEILPEADWQDFYRKALGFFRTVKLNKVRDIRPMAEASGNSLARDWRPNNNMFRGVADWFQHFGRAYGAFYYLEPDCTPLKRDWFSKLCAQYTMGRKPFMGVIRQAKKNDGSLLPRHMNGSGFYPNRNDKGLTGVSSFSPALYAASMNQNAEAAPFDVAGGATVVPHCQATNLICVDFNANPQINPEAVVWHGDKRHQLKFTLIEQFGGDPNYLRSGPNFSSELTSDLVKMPDRVAARMVDVSNALTPPKTFPEQQTPRITPPTNAYEAYSRALTAFGHDQVAWSKAVDDYVQKKLGAAEAVKNLSALQQEKPVSISGGKAEAQEAELADIFG